MPASTTATPPPKNWSGSSSRPSGRNDSTGKCASSRRSSALKAAQRTKALPRPSRRDGGPSMPLLRALRRWAMSDRVRASPREGKLLRLEEGVCVRIRGVSAQVTGRTVNHRATSSSSFGNVGGAAEVEYTCRTVTGAIRLHVRTDVEGSDLRVSIRGLDGVGEAEVRPDDIEIFG